MIFNPSSGSYANSPVIGYWSEIPITYEQECYQDTLAVPWIAVIVHPLPRSVLDIQKVRINPRTVESGKCVERTWWEHGAVVVWVLYGQSTMIPDKTILMNIIVTMIGTAKEVDWLLKICDKWVTYDVCFGFWENLLKWAARVVWGRILALGSQVTVCIIS